MLETFKARLKAKSTAAGANLSQKRIDAIADRLNTKFPDLTEESDHDEKIDDLYDPETLKDLSAADDFQRAKEKREADKKKAEALKKKTSSSKKKEKTDDDDDDDDDDEKPEKIPKWAESILSEVQSLKQEKAQSTIKTKADTLLKEIPASYWGKRALPEKEEDLAAFVEDVKTDYTTFKQDLVTEGLAVHTTPPAAGGGPTGGSGKVNPAIKAFVDKQKAADSKTT